MLLKWTGLIFCSCVISFLTALAFSVLRPQTHNIASIFGDAVFGVAVLILTLVIGWSWFIRKA
jgi:hypothetical protein